MRKKGYFRQALTTRQDIIERIKLTTPCIKLDAVGAKQISPGAAKSRPKGESRIRRRGTEFTEFLFLNSPLRVLSASAVNRPIPPK